jgi:CTP-dependent riboflavin kinase
LTCSTSHLKNRQQHLRNSHELTDGEIEQTQSENKLEEHLRKIYQGRKNIVKAIDGWGFDARGFINRQDFNEKIKEKLGI